MAHVRPDMDAVLPAAVGSVAALEPAITRSLAPPLATDPAAELMRQCQAGVAGAFDELMRRMHPRVASAIRGILRGSNDAEDITQQVFVKAYFGLPKFNFQSSVATWFYKIAVHECYDHLRRLKVRRTTLLADFSEEELSYVESLNANSASIERQVLARELAAKLLARLSPEDRILLVLKEVEGHSIQEVAAIMNMNQNTAKVRIFRARRDLLRAIQRKRV